MGRYVQGHQLQVVFAGKAEQKTLAPAFPTSALLSQVPPQRSIPAVQHLPLEAEARLHEGAGQPEPTSLEKLSPRTAQAWEGDGSR